MAFSRRKPWLRQICAFCQKYLIHLCCVFQSLWSSIPLQWKYNNFPSESTKMYSYSIFVCLSSQKMFPKPTLWCPPYMSVAFQRMSSSIMWPCSMCSECRVSQCVRRQTPKCSSLHLQSPSQLFPALSPPVWFGPPRANGFFPPAL